MKPCPLCGGYPAIYGIVTANGLIWRLRVCGGQTKDYSARDEAHKAWNRAVQKGGSDAEYTKKFLGNLEPSDRASGTDNHVSSAGFSGIAGRSAAPDLKGDTRDDERRTQQAP
ncbi:MAG: hypothetical protein IJU48_10055 [Synergistaceae bacterium]|nr:hypothetical protein [Synergistaceae bacterium]